MDKHLFISTKNFTCSRWTSAFPNALVHNDITMPPRVDKGNIVWVLTQTHQWEEFIAYYTQAGFSVIALTRSENIDELRASLEAGARGYLQALSNIDTLKQAAESVNQGAMWLPALLISRMVGNLSKLLTSKEPSHNLLDSLTAREKDVVQAILTGATNKEIARQLDITERTVKAHLSSIFSKLGARDRMHLMMLVRGY